jgi:enoyl-CoA hydratase
MPVSCTFDDGVALLSLELGRGGAIDPSFVDALHRALDEVEHADARAVVLTGKGRTFCGALDLVAIHAFDRAAMDRFIDALDSLFRRVVAFDRPVVAAINGHAIAGGCILAMACDFRVMADGPFHIGATEVQFGLPFPATAFEILRHATPAAALSAVMLQGKRFSAGEAHRAGLVHRLAGEHGPVPDAREEARLFAAPDPSAVRAVKADLTAPVLERIDATRAVRRARFLEHWFAPEAQARVGALRDELVGRSKVVSR